MNNLHLCKPLIRAIDSPNFDLSKFKRLEVVTYKYYCGHKAIYDGNLELALSNLQFAFDNCPDEHYKNKRMILLLLMPLKMLNYSVPKHQLLEKYNLTIFKNLIESINSGNVVQFDHELQSLAEILIQKGLYIVILKLKMVLIRNLFQNVYQITNSHQIRLEAFKTSFFVSNNRSSSDLSTTNGDGTILQNETLCYLINLISMGLIKGYISDKHQVLVLSKANPFPQEISIGVFEDKS